MSKQNATAFYKRNGFYLEKMGGNLTAFVKEVPDIGAQIIIQEFGDTGLAPNEVGAPVWVSLCTMGGEEMLAFKAAHGQAAMEMLARGESWENV